jgi:hypothetical protein
MIFDDANWDGVVAGAGRAIEELGFKVLYHKKMLNNAEDAHQWWNGLFIVVTQRETV